MLSRIYYPTPKEAGAEAFVARVNHLITAAMMATGVFFAFAGFYWFLGETGNAWLCLAGTVLSAGCLAWTRLVRPAWAAREILILGIQVLLLAMTWRLGGITAVTVIWLVCCPIIGTLTGGMVSGLAWAAVSILSAAWVYAWPVLGIEVPPPVLDKKGVELLAVVSGISLCMTVAIFIALFELRNRKSLARLKSALSTIEQLAIHDEVTGLFNRRHVLALLDEERRRSTRNGRTFSVCLIDIDHFKQINDRFGHMVGDKVLTEFAQLVASQVRATDAFGRYGGEEFMLVLLDTDEPNARQFIERIRASVEAHPFQSLPRDANLTASFGVAGYRGESTAADLVSRADAALYEAKFKGRNLVQLAT
jgi:diguanylate cyclase (GGDEF)-like protein